MAMRGGGGAGGRQRGALGVLLTGVILGLISVAVAAGNCVDDFDPDPLGAGTYSDVVNTTECGGGFTYTFTSDGDGPDATGGFGINANKLEPKSGAYNTNTTERLTIEQSDGKSFVFNSAWFDLHPSTGGTGFEIIGVGPEPFDSVFTGGPGSGPGVYGPADPKLVTRIEIYSVDFYLDWIDNVDVEITAPGIGIYDGATLVTNEVPADVVDVGSTGVGSPIDKILTIQSIGGAALDLTGSPYVTLSDDTHFQIQAQPSTDPIASGSSTNFTVRFNPTSSGVKTATVTILNDSEASPYEFQVEGEGSGNPEINVERPSGTTILDGDPDAQGSKSAGTPVTLTYTVRNTGDATLSVTNIEAPGGSQSNVSVGTITPTNFTVASGGGTNTFDVTYTPDDGGAFSFELDITNTDVDEGNYDITVSGTGTAPEINVERPASTTIADGGTDAQGSQAAGTQVTLTYTVRNTGTETLSVTNITSSGASNVTVDDIDPTSFTVASGGGTNTFDVKYTPTAAGAFSFELDITNDDVTEANYDLTVSGTGTAPEINIERPAGTTILDGGTDAQGWKKAGELVTLTYTVQNTGLAPLDVSSITSTAAINAVVDSIAPASMQIPAASVGFPVMSGLMDVQFTPTTDGAFSFELDFASNDSDEANYDITVSGNADGTPPVTTAGAGPSDPDNDSDPTFAFSVADTGGSGVASSSASLSGTLTAGPVVVVSGFALSDVLGRALATNGTEDGSYTMSVISTDNVGNVETTATWTWTYDSQAPGKPDSPDLDAGSDLGELQTDNITNDDTPTFFGLAGSVEGSATVEIRSSVAGALDTFLANGDGSWTYTVPGGSALAEGSHQIDIRAIDAAGNIGDYSDALTVLIDTTPPSVPTGLNPTDGEYTNDVPVTLSWSASSDPGGSGLRSTETYRYVVDGGSSGYTANTQYEPSLSEGDYVWRVRARDVAGNNSSYTTDRDLYIDTTDPNDPTPSSSSHAVGVPSKVTTIDIDIAFAGDEDPLSNGVSSGLDGFDTAFDKSPTWAATETLDEQETWTGGPFSATSDGSWYFHIATCDNAGNWTSTEHLGPFDIDTVPPSVVSVDASPTTVTDATVGSDTFTVTVVFNETMDTGTTPTLVYAPDVASGGTATITNGSGAWSDTNTTNDTYTVTYDVDDHDVDEDSVTIDVTGAKDVAQNDQNNYDPPVHEFAIDTANPKIQVNDINPSDTVVSDLDVGAGTFEVEVVYNESMNTGVTPTIAFTPNAEAGTLTLASDGWSDTVVTNDTYTATYNVADAGVTQLGVDIAVTGGEDLVGNVQDPASEADEFDVDTENPEFASFTVDGGLVDGGVPGGNCEITIDFDARATDANRSITAPCATIVDVTIIGNATEGTSTIVSQTQDGATAVDVAGTVEVSDLMSCPANVEVTLEITDDAGNTTQDMVRGADIDDVVVPVVSDLEFNTDATYTVQETDYDVDDCCEVTVYFSANVTDNCCIAWQNVGVTVTLPTGNAVLETINVQRAQTSDKRVDITGSAVVRCLTSCPARVEVEITATDCCGNAAVTQTTTAGEGLVWDNTDPVPNHDPLQHTYEDDRLDELDVRLDEYYVYRLVIRENTPERIDVIANDNDNCSLCTCCGTMWIDAITDAPDRGTATIEVDNGDCNGGSVIRYAPDRGYLGPDYFEYTVRDACGNVSAPVTVYLQMVEETVMEDVSVTTCEGETVEFRVAAADLWVDRDPVTIPFTFTIVSGPTHGALAGNVAELTYTPPSMRTDPNTRELVPTFDFTETGAIDLSYTPAEGFTGRDAVMIRFEDPFGAFDIARVDILVIPCETAAEGAAILRVGPEMILPIIVPESFRAIVETTPEAVILISHATGHVYPSALRVAWDESMNRHVLFLDTGPLPEGLYRLTIPLGTGAIVDLTIEVGETE